MQDACSGGKVCNGGFSIQCADPGDFHDPDHTVAQTECDSCQIKIRAPQGAGSVFSTCATLAHELIHAGDLCAHGICDGKAFGSHVAPGSSDCWSQTCSEIRGHCRQCCVSNPGDHTACFARNTRFFHNPRRSCWGTRITSRWQDLLDCCLPDSCNAVPDFRDAQSCLQCRYFPIFPREL